MSFDFRPDGFDGRDTDGQLYNSESLMPSEYYNCTWEALRQTARGYGYGGYDDAQLRAIANDILQRGDYQYGERWETNVAVAERNWPDLARDMRVDYPADVVAAIRAAGEQGYEVHCGFWCDSGAWVPPQGPIVYSHALRLLAGNNDGTLWVNPEPHPDQFLWDAQVRDLYDGGGLLVFARPVGPEFIRRPPKEKEPMLLDVEAGKIRFVAGPNADTYWNAISEGGTTLEVIAYDQNGQVLGSTGKLNLPGNVPNQHGPGGIGGQARSIGATGACSLGFVNSGGYPCTVMLHGGSVWA